VRYYFLTHHYRMPIEFSFEGLQSAQKSYERLIRLCLDCSDMDVSGYNSDVIAQMTDFLRDDLNTPGLLGVIFENIVVIAQNKQELAAVKNILVNVLGLTLQPLPAKEVVITSEIQSLIDARNKARHEKDWARADELRDQLEKLGFDVHDGKI
jgi:cysteinyl-tRNA synthetase